MKIADNVWLRSEGKSEGAPFVLGSITNVQQGGARLTVRRPDGTEGTFDNRSADVFRANPKGQVAPDHCALIHLNEPCILDNSKERYVNGDIYTYTGKILVALNPFEVLPIYGHALAPPVLRTHPPSAPASSLPIHRFRTAPPPPPPPTNPPTDSTRLNSLPTCLPPPLDTPEARRLTRARDVCTQRVAHEPIRRQGRRR